MAKKNPDKLTSHELHHIKEREAVVGLIIGALKDVSKFKLGDYLIAYRSDHNPRSALMAALQGFSLNPMEIKRELVTNSYGAPKKFKVVHVDQHGVPYMKELNKKGIPTGTLISPIHLENGDRIVKSMEYEFEVDPDYADAIILSSEAHYDASIVHKEKSQLFKDITEHNKSLKVNCHDEKELINFLKSLKVGDVVYKSIKTYFTITRMDPIPTSYNGSRLIGGKVFGQAQNSKGKTFDLEANIFKWSAIYKGRPRSYNELKDLK